MDATKRVRDPAQGLRPVHGLVADWRALDEPRDEVALGADERGHLGTHAHARRRDRRGVLDLPADAEQVGVVAREPHDPSVGRGARGDEEVPVRDPAREGGQREVPPGQLGEPAERRGERVVQLAAEDLCRSPSR